MQYCNFKYSCLLHDIASCILLLPGGQIRLNLSFLPVHKQSIFRVHNFCLPELFLSLPLPLSPLNVIHDPCNLHQGPQSLISGEHGAVLCDASSPLLPPPPFCSAAEGFILNSAAQCVCVCVCVCVFQIR